MLCYECSICKYISLNIGDYNNHFNGQIHKNKKEIFRNECLDNENIEELFKDNNITTGSLNNKIKELISKLEKLIHPIFISEMEYSNKINIYMEEHYPTIPFSLNHELTQFTIGKTEQTLNGICKRYIINQNESNEHLIEIIITNNSLLETTQWKVRTKNKLNNDDINIYILSSKKDSEYKHIEQFINNINDADTKNDLPNVLIICFHKQRVKDDLYKLFEHFSKKTLLRNTDFNIKFNLNFDEPDANLGVLSSFLNNHTKYNKIIKGIQLITATPYDELWNVLSKNNINQLLNINSIEDIEQQSYDDYLENYRQIKSHQHIINNNITNNPLEYIQDCMNRIIPNNQSNCNDICGSSNDIKQNIIFAPAHLYTTRTNVGSHSEVKDYFISLGYWVYLSNGKFKGFISPEKTEIALDIFNQKYNIIGELRDTMRKWVELYPTSNLAITGYWTIERGVTFNTNGFNFTHAIISSYHKRKLNKLIQLIGRTTGHKDYVQPMIIISTQEIKDIVDTTIEKTILLRENNSDIYTRYDFINSNKPNTIKPIIKEFDNHQEVVQYYLMELKSKIDKEKGKNGKGPRELKKDKDTGIYLCTIRSKKKQLVKEDIYSNLGCQIDQGSGYVYRAYYPDKNDINNVKFVIIHKPYI